MDKAEELIYRKLEIKKENTAIITPTFSLLEMEKEMIKKALDYVHYHH
ncbi:hypothetical protein [Brevibacillus sp. NRS-1366]